jgi:hypothetical protein
MSNQLTANKGVSEGHCRTAWARNPSNINVSGGNEKILSHFCYDHREQLAACIRNDSIRVEGGSRTATLASTVRHPTHYEHAWHLEVASRAKLRRGAFPEWGWSIRRQSRPVFWRLRLKGLLMRLCRISNLTWCQRSKLSGPPNAFLGNRVDFRPLAEVVGFE